MSEITEREVVRRERKASASARCAALFAAHRAESQHRAYVHGPCNDCVTIAAERHPLEKVIRARIAADPHEDTGGTQWKVECDTLWFRATPRDKWLEMLKHANGCDLIPTRRRVDLWSYLFANPTQEVEDDS